MAAQRSLIKAPNYSRNASQATGSAPDKVLLVIVGVLSTTA